jgi:hypothetical protein
VSEPASREDVERAKAEIIQRLDDENKATRAHIGNEVATVRLDVAHSKNFAERTLKAIKRFLSRHGIGSDDI